MEETIGAARNRVCVGVNDTLDWLSWRHSHISMEANLFEVMQRKKMNEQTHTYIQTQALSQTI